MITNVDAIRSLAPGASYAIVDDEIIWNSPDITQPTQAEIDAEIARLQAEYDAVQYQRDRKYPPIGDQLDSLFHAGVFPEEMAAQLQAVKDAHPKP